MLCCVVYDSCAQRYAHKYERFLHLCLVRITLGPASIFACFCVSLDHFGFVLLVLLGFVFFSVLSQETGWEERVLVR